MNIIPCALIVQLKGYILQKNDDIHNQQIFSCDNLVDVFIKSLPSMNFEQLIQKIDLHHLGDDCLDEGEI